MKLTEEQEKFYQKYSKMMERPSSEQIESDYQDILNQIKGKTYLEILPKDLVSRSDRSIIKRLVMYSIEDAFDILNNDSIAKEYYPNGITKENIVVYITLPYYAEELKNKLIETPNVSDIMGSWLNDLGSNNYSEEEKLEIYSKAKVKIDKANHILNIIRGFSNCMSTYYQYKARKEIIKGIGYDDVEKNGFPRMGRGNVCTSYYPIKDLKVGLLGKHKFLTRNGKEIELHLVSEYSEKGDDTVAYKAIDSKNKTMFLIDYLTCEYSYDALFDINKEINRGWWNRELKIVQ